MTHRLSPSFTTNLIFGVLLFLITITFRTKLVYALIDNIYLVATLLHAWNWLMLLSLGIAAVQSLTLAYRHGGLYYMLLSIGGYRVFDFYRDRYVFNTSGSNIIVGDRRISPWLE